jgi:hypothetical protein
MNVLGVCCLCCFFFIVGVVYGDFTSESKQLKREERMKKWKRNLYRWNQERRRGSIKL